MPSPMPGVKFLQSRVEIKITNSYVDLKSESYQVLLKVVVRGGGAFYLISSAKEGRNIITHHMQPKFP